MEFMFDDSKPLIDESWDLEGELFDIVCEMSDEEKNLLLEAEQLPDLIYEAIAKTSMKEAA